MFYFIKPKENRNLLLKTLAFSLFPKDSQIQVIRNRNLRAFNLLWKVEKNRTENVGFIDFYYNISDDKITLDAISLEFEYKIPLYVNFEDVIREVLKYLHKTIGNFEMYDLYLQRKLQIRTKEERSSAVTIITDERNESYTEEMGLLSQISNESDIDKVFEKIRTFPEQFRIYSYSAYIAQLKRANLNTQEKIEKIFRAALDILSAIEDQELSTMLLFKLILYYKSFSSSYVDLVSYEFLIRELLPVLVKLPIHKEIAQLLITDSALYLLNTNNPQLVQDSLKELLRLMSNHSDIYVLYPEIKTIYTLNTSGNYKKTFAEYLKRTQNRKLELLRKQYELIVTDGNLVTDFRQQVILNNYYKKLYFWDKIQYLPFVWKNKVRNSALKVYTGLIVGFLALCVYIFPYLYYFSLNGAPRTQLLTDIFTRDFIIGSLLTVGGIALLYWYLVILIRALVMWFIKGAQSVIIKVLVAAVSIPLLMSILTSFTIMSIVIVYELVSGSSLWGVSNGSLVNGYENVPFSSITKLMIKTLPCKSTTACNGPLVTIAYITQLKQSETSFTVSAFSTNKEKQTACMVLNNIKQEAAMQNLQLTVTVEDEKVLASICP